MTSRRATCRMLLVDSDESAARTIHASVASRFSCEVATTTPENVKTALSSASFHVIVSRDEPKGTNGLDLLANARAQSPRTRVILVGSDASPEKVLEADRQGAFEYLTWPADETILFETIDRALGETPPKASSSIPPAPRPRVPGTVIGSSAALVDVLDAVDRVAHSTSPVLLIGETGTGKDLIAARIHDRGPRRHQPYVVVNAGAIPSTLLDSELFVHVAGAFTGATKARRGLIVDADGGTLSSTRSRICRSSCRTPLARPRSRGATTRRLAISSGP